LGWGLCAAVKVEGFHCLGDCLGAVGGWVLFLFVDGFEGLADFLEVF
jgi:hypothetical protein